MNQIIVFSKTRNNWITPQNTPFRCLTGRLRKREGDEHLIEIGTGYFKQHKKFHACFYIPPKKLRVRVEKSENGFWWLVNMENTTDA